MWEFRNETSEPLLGFSKSFWPCSFSERFKDFSLQAINTRFQLFITTRSIETKFMPCVQKKFRSIKTIYFVVNDFRLL